MNKKENYDLVREAEKKVIEKVGKKYYYMLGSNQQAQLVQEELPTKPLYCLAKVRSILNGQ